MNERMKKVYAMRDVVGMVTSLDELTEEKVATLGMNAMWFLGCNMKAVDYEVTEDVKVSGGRKKGGRKVHARSKSLKNKVRYGKTKPTREERKNYRLYVEKRRYSRLLDGQCRIPGMPDGIRGEKMKAKVADAFADYNEPSRVTLDEDEEITLSTVDNRSTRERIAEISAKAVEIQKRIDALRKRYNC